MWSELGRFLQVLWPNHIIAAAFRGGGPFVSSLTVFPFFPSFLSSSFHPPTHSPTYLPILPFIPPPTHTPAGPSNQPPSLPSSNKKNQALLLEREVRASYSLFIYCVTIEQVLSPSHSQISHKYNEQYIKLAFCGVQRRHHTGKGLGPCQLIVTLSRCQPLPLRCRLNSSRTATTAEGPRRFLHPVGASCLVVSPGLHPKPVGRQGRADASTCTHGGAHCGVRTGDVLSEATEQAGVALGCS